MPASSPKKQQHPRLSKLVGFAITTRPERATQFYRDMLGFKFIKDDGFALVFDAHGTLLRISKLKKFKPAEYTILGWQVDDIETTVRGLKAQGITFERYSGLPQDENAICTFPGEAKVAWFKDPDGNVLSVSQHL
ncbi:MAG TPA: VOC family protein [Terriglobales bacterium]|nr:VOC family protein [Terriglobales bacterium]